jgi:hypothetical protein
VLTACLRPNGIQNSVPSSLLTENVSITGMNRLMLFQDVIAVCCENQVEGVDVLYGKCGASGILRALVHRAVTVHSRLNFPLEAPVI